MGHPLEVPEDRLPGRRALLKRGLFAGAVLLVAPRRLLAAVPVGSPAGPARALSFLNAHTGERLEATYFRAGEYQPDGLRAIDHVLRDHRTGEAKAVDRGLLDLLHTLRGELGTAEPFHVISGYRSPGTNARLAARSRGGVARHSLHMKGMAIDIQLPGVRLAVLREAALGMKAGGVGYYPDLGFVHLDVGRVRRW
jgi:uncharacterized protein YcbK (DUF882 family)